MMRRLLITGTACAILLALSATGNAQQIYGDYVESRSADVYTGFCFANSEVGLAGDQAIMAWRVEKGEWDGVTLDGLSVVGVVKANATLGDPFGKPYPAKAVVIVDEKASSTQRDALMRFAQCMAGDLLRNVTRVEVEPIALTVSHKGGHPGSAILKAGSIASIQTRSISDKDHVCGNEDIYYEPLTVTSHAMPAVAELDRFSGEGLGVSWTVSGKRSAYVGAFSR